MGSLFSIRLSKIFIAKAATDRWDGDCSGKGLQCYISLSLDFMPVHALATNTTFTYISPSNIYVKMLKIGVIIYTGNGTEICGLVQSSSPGCNQVIHSGANKIPSSFHTTFHFHVDDISDMIHFFNGTIGEERKVSGILGSSVMCFSAY